MSAFDVDVIELLVEGLPGPATPLPSSPTFAGDVKAKSFMVGPGTEGNWLKVFYDENGVFVGLQAYDKDGDTGNITYGRNGDADTPYWWLTGARYFGFADDGMSPKVIGWITCDQAPGVIEQADAALVLDPNGSLPVVLGAFGGGQFVMLRMGPVQIRVADDGTTDFSGMSSGCTWQDFVSFQNGVAATTVVATNVEIQGGHLDLPTYTVATLPFTNTVGRTVFCTNARNAGEGAGSGTGSIVVWSGSKWHLPGVSSAVTA